jgi:hypothetical protein
MTKRPGLAGGAAGEKKQDGKYKRIINQIDRVGSGT